MRSRGPWPRADAVARKRAVAGARGTGSIARHWVTDCTTRPGPDVAVRVYVTNHSPFFDEKLYDVLLDEVQAVAITASPMRPTDNRLAVITSNLSAGRRCGGRVKSQSFLPLLSTMKSPTLPNTPVNSASHDPSQIRNTERQRGGRARGSFGGSEHSSHFTRHPREDHAECAIVHKEFCRCTTCRSDQQDHQG